MTMPAPPGSSGVAANAAKRLPSAASSSSSSCETAAPEMTGIGGEESCSKHTASRTIAGFYRWRSASPPMRRLPAAATTTVTKGGRMRQSVLVAYATKRGSTREVAETIADRLAWRGFETRVSRADDIADVAGFDGVVLGGSIYMGRWHPDARAFLKRHREALAALPFA